MLTTPPEERDQIRASNRGSRVYEINGKKLPSVTNLVSRGEPKPVLVNWAKKVTAEAAVAQHDLVGQLINTDGEKAAIDHLKGAAFRQRDAAGDLGSKLHEVAEYEIIMGKPYPDPGDPDAQRLLLNFRDFVQTMNPTWHAVEAVVVNESYGYAGTLDAIATLSPNQSSIGALNDYINVPTMVDWKSGKGVYGSYALQLAAYVHAEYLLGPNGQVKLDDLLPEPRAVVVHITQSGWQLVAVDVSQPVFEAFLSVANVAIDWVDSLADTVIGTKIAHGRATGGKSLRVGGAAPKGKPDPAEVARSFQRQRRIKPPALG